MLVQSEFMDGCFLQLAGVAPFVWFVVWCCFETLSSKEIASEFERKTSGKPSLLSPHWEIWLSVESKLGRGCFLQTKHSSCWNLYWLCFEWTHDKTAGGEFESKKNKKSCLLSRHSEIWLSGDQTERFVSNYAGRHANHQLVLLWNEIRIIEKAKQTRAFLKTKRTKSQVSFHKRYKIG